MERRNYKKVLSGGGLIFDRGLEKFQKSQGGGGRLTRNGWRKNRGEML